MKIHIGDKIKTWNNLQYTILDNIDDNTLSATTDGIYVSKIDIAEICAVNGVYIGDTEKIFEPELVDYRKELGDCLSSVDFEKARMKNIREGVWACPCGSDTFKLQQGPRNVKAICTKCGNFDIIYWNRGQGQSAGHMRILDTNKWTKMTTVLVEENL